MAFVTLKGNPVHISGELPQIGETAPDFILVDSHLKNRRLSDFSGKKKLLYIVPSLDTDTCALSTKRYNEEAHKSGDLQIIIISADLPFAQKRFCAHNSTKNVTTLSMMRSQDFAKDYGILIVDGPLQGICARAQLVLNKDNKIIYRELVQEIADEPDYESALKELVS